MKHTHTRKNQSNGSLTLIRHRRYSYKYVIDVIFHLSFFFF